MKNKNFAKGAGEAEPRKPDEAEAAATVEEPQASQEAQATGGAEQENREATVEEWQKALETAVAQRDEYLESLRRTQADFQNFKRRNATSRSDGYEDGTREVIVAILPAIDNLERALDAADKAGVSDGLVDGVRMTLNTMLDSLKGFGFEEVPAEGQPFDPEKHNAVMRESGETPGMVLQVFQKGYKVKDKIVRYAMVKVSAE